MPGYTIVALPSEDDRVRLYSSEKEPHLTLLYLGEKEPPNLSNVIEFVQHVAETSLRQFTLFVDRRGTLGSKEADVLFFERDWTVPNLERCRAYLLTNPNISLAYNSTPQFPSFTPHLTLGYPDTPARISTYSEEHPRISVVGFDRLAIWTDDSSGPTFDLAAASFPTESYHSDIQKSADRYFEDLENKKKLSHSILEDENFLAHYGVLGMRWGRRRPRGSDGLIKRGSEGAPSGKRAKGEREPRQAVDHLRNERNMKKSVDRLSNKDIKAIQARLQAQQEFAKIQQQLKEADRGPINKLVRWGLSNASEGIKSGAEDYIKSTAEELTSGILGDPKSFKDKFKKKEAPKAEEKSAPKSEPKLKKEQTKTSPEPPRKTRRVKAEFIQNTDTPKPQSQKALDDIVYNITTLK